MWMKLVCVLLFVTGGYLAWSEIRKMRHCTEETTATIIDVITSHHRSKGRSHNTYSPKVEFLAAGKTIQAKAGASSSVRGKYKTGETLEIKYNPEKPEEIVLKGMSSPYMIMVGLLLFVLGIAGLFLKI